MTFAFGDSGASGMFDLPVHLINQLSLMCTLHFRIPSSPSISRHNVGLFPGVVLEIRVEEFLSKLLLECVFQLSFVAIPNLTTSDQSNSCSTSILACSIHRNHDLLGCLEFHCVTVRSIPNFPRTNEVAINIKGISVVARHSDAEAIDSPFCLDDFAEWTS